MNLLGMFAKHWTPGQVKTRLATAIGFEAAAEVHRAFVATCVQRFGAIADRRLLAFTPPESEAEFRLFQNLGWEVAVQGSGDLGSRMQQFFAEAFHCGAKRVVLIGSDSPTLPIDFLEQAFERLKTSTVVLAPAEDGGYCLLGAAEAIPPVFSGISWGTPSVLDQTEQQLRAAGVDFSLLPSWHDVDTLDDLERIHGDLQRLAKVDRTFAAAFHTVASALRCK